MILGLGTDIANMERIEKTLEKFGGHFIEKNFTPAERTRLAQCKNNIQRCAAVSKLFAAKEAAVKALGSGFSQGISHQDVEIGHDELGKPLLFFHRKAGERLQKMCNGKSSYVHLSLSDDFPFAQAVVIIEIL